MSGTALSQDTYLNKDTPLTVIGGGGGGGSVNSVTGLAPNIIAGTVAGAVTVGLTSSIAGISSIAFGGAYGNITGVSTINGYPAAGASASGQFSTIYMNPTTGNIRNALTITGVSTITGNGLEIDFQNTGDNTDPWGYVAYENSAMSMNCSQNIAGGGSIGARVGAAISTLSLSAEYLSGAATVVGLVEITPSKIVVGGVNGQVPVNFTSTTVTIPALTVSTINGAGFNAIPVSVDIPTGLGGQGLTDGYQPANTYGTVPLGLSTVLTAKHRYIYSPTFGLSTSGAGGWPAGNATASCWVTGQTSELLGGPWTYAGLSTSKGIGSRAILTPTAMFGSVAATGQNGFVPQIGFSADWPMNTIVAVSSLQASNGDFYATTLVDLGIPANA